MFETRKWSECSKTYHQLEFKFKLTPVSYSDYKDSCMLRRIVNPAIIAVSRYILRINKDKTSFLVMVADLGIAFAGQ